MTQAVSNVNTDRLIETYWPESEWVNAKAMLANILTAYQPPACHADPVNCVARGGPHETCYDWQTPAQTHRYGLWLITDACWNPDLAAAETPFTAAEWAQVLDPNVNTWMASVIWSIGGWGKFNGCNDIYGDDPIAGVRSTLCLHRGGPVPQPRHPVAVSAGGSGLIVAALAVAAIGGLAYLDSQGMLS